MGDRVVHFEIGCRDIAETAAFYQRVFDWTIEEQGSSGRRIDTGGERDISGHITALGHEPHAYLNFYIEVEDIAAKIEAVVAAGGEALIGPLPTPDGQIFAWVKDVAGNTIGLLEKA